MLIKDVQPCIISSLLIANMEYIYKIMILTGMRE